MHRSIIAISSVALGAAASAQQASPVPQPVPQSTAQPTPRSPPRPAGDEAAATARAAAIGVALYTLDRAAWVASDAAVAALSREALQQPGGWVIEPAADRGAVVTFYRGALPDAQAVFVATVRDGKVGDSRTVTGRVSLTPMQIHLAQARATALAEASTRHFAPCTPAPFNPVVLPARTADGPVAVYLLSAQLKNGEYPAGGHYRILIGADGKVAGERAFTKGCLTLATPALPKGAKPMGMFVNHLLDATPTEIHVFTSLTARMPLFVGTPGGRVWQVAGPRITLIKAGGPEK